MPVPFGPIPASTITSPALTSPCFIAAIAPITGAGEEEIAISLGTVFVLNSVALLTFPLIGTLLHMTQTQFGLWAALAIHDTSSVVGATAKYGAGMVYVNIETDPGKLVALDTKTLAVKGNWPLPGCSRPTTAASG